MIKVTNADQAGRLLAGAARRGFPVTVTYTREDGTQTVRTIEVISVKRSKAGNRYASAMVRTDTPGGELRSFRLDRISFLTVHRTAYILTVPVPKSMQVPTVRPVAEILREMAEADVTPVGTLQEVGVAA